MVEIVVNLSLQQQLCWQRSAVKCLQVAVEEYLVMNMTASMLGAAHASRVTLIVSDLRLVDDIMNVMVGKPDWKIQEEQKCHLRQAAFNCCDDNNNDNSDDDNNDNPPTTKYYQCSRLSYIAGNAKKNNGDNGNDGGNGDSSGMYGNGEDVRHMEIRDMCTDLR
ncbi:hypothetical protein HOY80DRAFT_1054841 [Tuber brumale]|nr:hypothetical protein HOY80DRAFT_1054841 [Tuber brumale]